MVQICKNEIFYRFLIFFLEKVCRNQKSVLTLQRKTARALFEDSKNGVVVQLVRIPACHAGGRGFESRPYRRGERRMSYNNLRIIFTQSFFCVYT